MIVPAQYFQTQVNRIMTSEKNQLIRGLQDKVAGWIGDGLVIADNIALRKNNAVGNMKHFKNPAEYLNRGFKFFRNHIVRSKRQQVFDIGDILCPYTNQEIP